jgi:hypothetical protein
MLERKFHMEMLRSTIRCEWMKLSCQEGSAAR